LKKVLILIKRGNKDIGYKGIRRLVSYISISLYPYFLISLYPYILISPFFAKAQSIEQTLSFAALEFSNKNYTASVDAYLRVYFFDKGAHGAIVYPRLAESYFELKDYAKAGYYYDLAYNVSLNDSIRTEMTLRKALCLLLDHKYLYSLQELLPMEDSLAKGQFEKKEFYIAITYFGMSDFKQSEQAFLLSARNAPDSTKTKIHDLFVKNAKIRLNPKTARILSYIFPGLGQFYAGDVKNGINSLLLTSGFAVLAVTTALNYSLIDAIASVAPWFQRYYTGGIKKAEAITVKKISTRRAKIYTEIIDTLKNIFAVPQNEDILKYKARLAYTAIYNFEFSKADSIILEIKKEFPGNIMPFVVASNYYWWLLISGYNDAETEKKYSENIDLALKLLVRTPTTGKTQKLLSNEEIYYFTVLHGYKARLLMMQKKYYKAISNFKTSIDYLELSKGKEPEYEYFYLLQGLNEYFVAHVRKDHPFYAPFIVFFPKADAQKGLDYLKIAATSKDTVLNTEGNYFLVKINMEAEVNYKEAEQHALLLINRYEKNLLYQYFYFKLLLDEKRKQEAINQLAEINKAASVNPNLAPAIVAHYKNLAQHDLKKYYMEE